MDRRLTTYRHTNEVIMQGYRPRPEGPITGLPGDTPTLWMRCGIGEIVTLDRANACMSGHGEWYESWLRTGRGSSGAGVYYEVQEADTEPAMNQAF